MQSLSLITKDALFLIMHREIAWRTHHPMPGYFLHYNRLGKKCPLTKGNTLSSGKTQEPKNHLFAYACLVQSFSQATFKCELSTYCY